jgi:hypothetical protein
MKRSKLFLALMIALTALSLAGVARASMTERLEARFLKSRTKMRIDENWKVKSGSFTGAEVAVSCR